MKSVKYAGLEADYLKLLGDAKNLDLSHSGGIFTPVVPNYTKMAVKGGKRVICTMGFECFMW